MVNFENLNEGTWLASIQGHPIPSILYFVLFSGIKDNIVELSAMIDVPNATMEAYPGSQLCRHIPIDNEWLGTLTKVPEEAQEMLNKWLNINGIAIPSDSLYCQSDDTIRVENFNMIPGFSLIFR